ncbi:immunity protein Imm33 domain-containing protein [Myxococcus xanthus]|uniref:Imm33-like domain-containing protein n=1 Tax=Myxococcus xanthus TaxID=34 RepID=A0A7Y4ICV2_MYXXA|nr:hypothetical protein [Myxococcus xanthus]NOJ76942.1 hypothetical protein [Myxococcus xanthus]NOJ84547.1 hypothetical protein [Myxococcus xanthus]
MSKYIREVQGRRFAVFCDERFERQAKGMLNVLERMALQGSAFKDADVFNFGGIPFSLRSAGEDLVVSRPVIDGAAVFGPGDDLSPLLLLLLRQISFAKKVGTAPEQVNLQDKVIVEEDCLSEAHVYMERATDVPPGDSGWFVGFASEVERDRILKSYRIWQLLHIRPSIVGAMALPSGFLVVWDGEAVLSVLDSNENERWIAE